MKGVFLMIGSRFKIAAALLAAAAFLFGGSFSFILMGARISLSIG